MDGKKDEAGMKDCGPVERAASRVGWYKVLIGAAITLLAAGAMATMYVSSFARADDVRATVESHEKSDSPHPNLRRDLQGVQERLIRVETVQQQMATTQDRMDQKLDRLLSGGAAWRVPPASPPQSVP